MMIMIKNLAMFYSSLTDRKYFIVVSGNNIQIATVGGNMSPPAKTVLVLPISTEDPYK